MNTTLFIIILLSLAAICLLAGKRASKKAKNQDEYFLGGRNIRFFGLTLALLATQVGGGVVLGAAEEAYLRGWPVILYPLGTCIGLILLAIGFGAKMRRQNLTTVAEIFEKVYQSPFLRKASSLLSIVSLFFILVAQGIAARKFFLALGFDQHIFFFGFWAVLILYTVMGGLKAIVDTDFIQIIYIMGTFAVALVCTWFFSDFVPIVAAPTELSSDLPWVGWFFMPLLFTLIEQDMGQLCFSAKSTRIVSVASATAALLLFVCTLCPIYFGVMAHDMGITVPAGSSILVATIQQVTNPIVATMFCCAILMAIVSTANSLLCAIGSNLSCDFLARFRSAGGVFTAKAITFAAGMAAMTVSYLFTNVVGIMIAAYELSVSVLLVPVVMAALLNTPQRSAACAAMVAGAASFVAFRLWEPPMPHEIATIVLSLAAFTMVQAMSRQVDEVNVVD